jgi:hypothetical protein
MLELMIALILLAMCILPLGRLPFTIAREEFNSAYRMQAQRLADLAFAEVKEKRHRQEIPWKDIARTREDGATVFNEDVDVSFDPLGKRTFLLTGTLHSVGKKGQNSEEYRLATVRIKVEPKLKQSKMFRSKKNRVTSQVFTYQVLIHKTSAQVLAPAAPPITNS